LAACFILYPFWKNNRANDLFGICGSLSASADIESDRCHQCHLYEHFLIWRLSDLACFFGRWTVSSLPDLRPNGRDAFLVIVLLCGKKLWRTFDWRTAVGSMKIVVTAQQLPGHEQPRMEYANKGRLAEAEIAYKKAVCP